MTIYNTIVACNQIFGIGHRGKIPWNVPADMSYFNMRTMGHAVLMGRVTYESIGFLLPGRHNIIISSKLTADDIKTQQSEKTQQSINKSGKTESTVNYKNIYDVHHTHEQKTTFAVYNSIVDCIIDIEGKYKEVFVIGGQKIYEYFIFNNLVHFEFITLIPYFGPIDTFYPAADRIKIHCPGSRHSRKTNYTDINVDYEYFPRGNIILTSVSKIPYCCYRGTKTLNFYAYEKSIKDGDDVSQYENILSSPCYGDYYSNSPGELLLHMQYLIFRNDNQEEQKFLQKLKNILYTLQETHETQPNAQENTPVHTHAKVNKYADEIIAQKIYKNGIPPTISVNRTAARAAHEIGVRLEFSLRGNQFPLLTTRKLFLRGIFEEIMFYLRGQTDSKILEGLGVNVWCANTTREELDKRGFHNYPVGDMGPTYGFALRHFGAEYINCDVDYTNCGVDQLADLIKNIIEVKKNPGHASARRLILNMWDATNVDKMVLPPCLYNYQFSVEGDFLSCFATQRSSDVVVAGGWNIAQVALITILIAHVTDLIPNRIIWNVCNMHIYENLKEAAEQQIKREPFIFPKIYINNTLCATDINVPDTDEKSAMARLLNFKFEDLILVNYNAHPNIKVEMNV